MPCTGRERTPPAGLSLPLTEVKMMKNGGRRTAKERKRGEGMKQKRKTEERERSGMYHEE